MYSCHYGQRMLIWRYHPFHSTFILSPQLFDEQAVEYTVHVYRFANKYAMFWNIKYLSCELCLRRKIFEQEQLATERSAKSHLDLENLKKGRGWCCERGHQERQRWFWWRGWRGWRKCGGRRRNEISADFECSSSTKGPLADLKRDSKKS